MDGTVRDPAGAWGPGTPVCANSDPRCGLGWLDDAQKPPHSSGFGDDLEMGPVQMWAGSLGGSLLPEFHTGREGLLETFFHNNLQFQFWILPSWRLLWMQDQDHHPGPAFFIAITKRSEFRHCLLLLALGILSGAPALPPWLFQSALGPLSTCREGGAAAPGWPRCRIRGGESVPSCRDSFSCFFWHQEFHRESASWKHP